MLLAFRADRTADVASKDVLSFTFFLSLGSSWPCGIGVFLPLLLLAADFPETGVFPDPDGLETGDPPSLDSASKYEKHY